MTTRKEGDPSQSIYTMPPMDVDHVFPATFSMVGVDKAQVLYVPLHLNQNEIYTTHVGEARYRFPTAADVEQLELGYPMALLGAVAAQAPQPTTPPPAWGWYIVTAFSPKAHLDGVFGDVLEAFYEIEAERGRRAALFFHACQVGHIVLAALASIGDRLSDWAGSFRHG